jgi:oligopeptide/dipeptide ABC transporter ATP-binding protein
MTSQPVTLSTGIPPAGEPDSNARRTGLLRRLRRQPVTLASIGFLLLLAAVAVAAPWIAPYDPLDQDLSATFQGPSAEHLLGTNQLGQDTLSRVLYASRVALQVAFGSVFLAMLIGVPIGLLLGYRGGWYDRLGSRLIDVADALPGMLVGFAVIAILGRSMLNLIVAIGVIFCMGFARTTRAVTLAEREKLYVDAARVAGLRTPAILFRQVLPNLAGVVVVQATVLLGAAIMVEAALSFLGIGLDGQVPTWGGMLGEAAANSGQPFMAFPPGLAIILTVLSFNLLGDGLNDALSGGAAPTSRSRRRKQAATRAAAHPAAEAGTAEAPVVTDAVLAFRDVTVAVDQPGTSIPLVRDVSLSIGRAEVVALLGESGSGKSMLARSALGLLPTGVRFESGSVRFEGKEIGGLDERGMREVRGRGIAVVLQDPMSALSPVHTIGVQLCEPLRAHFGLSRADARARATELLDRVGVENAGSRLDDYPHQFSGGMAQRVAIAIALATEPRLLIADEATSALDVTTQSQVLDLLLDLRAEMDMSILLITHDLGVVAESCDRAAVMYAGEIVEVNDVTSLFDRPQHPYTAALLAANPSGHGHARHLPTIPGRVPMAGEWPVGCHFANRCQYAAPACTAAPVPLVHDVRCVRVDELSLEVAHS